jgi:hypothetical protein
LADHYLNGLQDYLLQRGFFKIGLEFSRFNHIAVKETPYLSKYKTGGVYDNSNLPYLLLIRKLLDKRLRD